MLEIWTISLPILIVDVANPVLLAVVIVCASTDRPTFNSLMLILGHTLNYLLFGLLVIYGLADTISELLNPLWELFQNPEPADFVVGFLIGILLVWVAAGWKTNPPDTSEKTPDTTKRSPFGYLLFGAVVNVVGAPFAIPYIAFLNQLTRVDSVSALPNLILYNLLYAAPFLLVPLAVALFGSAILPLLERVNKVVEKYSAYIMPILFGGLGLALIVDAGLYFATGSGLF